MSQVLVSPPVREPQNPQPLNERQRAMRITRVIRKAEQRLRRRHGILNRQNFLGSLIFFASAAGFIASSGLYLGGLIPAWACVLLNAFFASVLHELEHDLIHNLYFRNRPVLQNAMMLGVWSFRCNTINPWYRRHLHLLHHKESGQQTDLEERLLGNGMPLGLSRVISTVDVFIGSLLRWGELTKVPACSPRGLILAGVPFMAFFWCTWYVWLLYHGANLAAGFLGAELPSPSWLPGVVAVLNSMVVIYALPNVLRQVCLSIISSNMHYYGDVDELLHQTQVLNAWYFWPLQLFCCNFGSTHGIHHFVVPQPFYLRQLVAPAAHAAMRKYGVRFNDLGTFRRANRYQAAPQMSD